MFLRLILPQAGLAAPGATDMAGSFLTLPRSGPHRNAIVVLGRRGRATHVAIVESVGPAGVAIISGNWGHRVGRGIVSGIVSPSSVLAYVQASPSSVAAAIPWPIRHARRHRHPKSRPPSRRAG